MSYKGYFDRNIIFNDVWQNAREIFITFNINAKLLKHPHEQQSPSLLTLNFNSKWTLKLLLYVDVQNILCKFDVAIQQYAIKIRRNEGISTHLYAVDGIEDEKNLSYNKKHSRIPQRDFWERNILRIFFSFSP
mgnify:FL=1